MGPAVTSVTVSSVTLESNFQEEVKMWVEMFLGKQQRECSTNLKCD